MDTSVALFGFLSSVGGGLIVGVGNRLTGRALDASAARARHGPRLEALEQKVEQLQKGAEGGAEALRLVKEAREREQEAKEQAKALSKQVGDLTVLVVELRAELRGITEGLKREPSDVAALVADRMGDMLQRVMLDPAYRAALLKRAAGEGA